MDVRVVCVVSSDVNDLQGQVEIECWDANNLIKTEMLGRVALNIADVVTLCRPDRVGTPHFFFVSFNTVVECSCHWLECMRTYWRGMRMECRHAAASTGRGRRGGRGYRDPKSRGQAAVVFPAVSSVLRFCIPCAFHANMCAYIPTNGMSIPQQC